MNRMIPKRKQLNRQICLAAALVAMAAPLVAGPIWDGITNVVSTLRADGSTNNWTEADLVDALGLLNRRYWRDMETDAGRRAWHGSLAASAAGTNAQGRLVRRDVYADGYVHETAAKMAAARPGPVGGAGGAAERIARLEERIATNAAEIAAIPLESLVDGGDAAERYARLAVERRRLERMLERERARRTNVVSVTVTPQTGGM